MQALAFAVALSAGMLPSHAATPVKAPAVKPPRGDAVAGKEKADDGRCFECHGADGQGSPHANASGGFARLAGQHAPYLVKQLQDFRSGARKHDVMRVMAQHLDDEDRRDIAAYFASQPAPPGDTVASAEATTGQTLYAQACVACHGEQGRGSASAGPLVPVLAGQEAGYLEQQLRDWRSAWRSNSPQRVMNQVTQALSDAQISALAAYLSAQPAPGVVKD